MSKAIYMETKFLQAYDAWADDVFRFCLFRLPSRERAQDIAQETFLRAWNQLAAGVEITNLRAFLYRVARNLIADEYRRRTSASLEELAEIGFDPAAPDNPARDVELALVRRALDQLDDEERDLMLLRHVNGLSVKDIADALGITQNAASVRLHRALKKTRDHLS